MLNVFVIVVVMLTAAFLGYRIGLARGMAKGAIAYVRPRVAHTVDRMAVAEPTEPPVSQAVFVRDNLPGSTSKME